MDTLRNLQEIYNSVANKFNQYRGEDFVLPQVFKDQVKEINSNVISYNKYSAVIETRGNQNGVLNIYLPNQWFYIASYFTDFYRELLKYKRCALKVVSKERLKDLNGANLTDAEQNAIKELDIDEQSQEYLIKFITDYSWWSGAKTIDRGDFYVSPILNSARLVNASQSFVADLCAFLADKEELVKAIISGEEFAEFGIKKVLLRQKAAATFMKKAMKITLGKDGNLSHLEALKKYKKTSVHLLINGFNLGRDKNQLPKRIDDVDLEVEWIYNTQKYVLYLEWAPEMMEKHFFPVYNEAYKGMLKMGKDTNGEYVLYEDVEDSSETGFFQQIFYGAPGSGKSNKVKKLLEGEYPDETDRDKFVFRTTFHPDSDYSTFVGCYKPRMEDDKIKYEFSPQTFTDAYVKAWQNPDKQVYLVIEEINRGNCAQIFGDLFQLLDRKKGVSEYPINADADLRQYLEKEDVLGVGHEGIANGKLKLPANLNILATMNTSDQSLFPMDSAFKRRWSWESVPIDYKNVDSSKFIITIGDNQYKWTTFLESVNKRIVKATDSEDKQMGNFFINDNVDEHQFIDKVMFYLWNDVCKEEFHTTNNFFRNYTDDKKTETIEFSFNALFESNSTKLLQGFMEYLEVRANGDGSKNPDTEGNTESEAE